MEKFDVVVIGSGLGGLLCAKTMSDEGYKVCVLEKNRQIGGSLQTFVRDRVIFDTGVHYIGGLEEGQPLYKFFNYFGLMDNLKLERLDEDHFEEITIAGETKPYFYGQGYDNFKRVLKEQFPNDGAAIDSYCDLMQEICHAFPMYNVEDGDELLSGSKYFNINAKQYFQELTPNVRLQNVLAATNVLYAGEPEITPLYVHALVVNSYIESSYRPVNGSSQIASYLTKCIRNSGGKVLNKAEVIKVQMDEEDEKVSHLILKDGRTFAADHYISNIHPAVLLSMLDTHKIRKAYRNRISDLRNTASIFIANVVMKKEAFNYSKRNIYHYEVEDVWSTIEYQPEQWPLSFALYYGASTETEEFAEGITVMAYMKFDECEQWSNTFNIVSQEDDRGADYEQFKKEKAEKLFDVVEKRLPGFKAAIHSYTVATPLTYRDYVNTVNGSIYGVSKDCHDPLKTFISPRTKIPNLFITGQNLHMHGVYGVTVGAVKTCSEILGQGYLIKKIQDHHQKHVLAKQKELV
jgi:all-trans-retinol 13,14-reductase